MIRIRYKDLSGGVHAKAHRPRHRRRGDTTIYLQPGLTAGQRRAALRRLRQEASRGYGPPLPLKQLALAIGADRARAGLRAAAAVIRLHPAASLLPALVAGALTATFVLASATVRIIHLPGGDPPGGANPGLAAHPGPGARPASGRGASGGGTGLGSGTHARTARKTPARGSATRPAAVTYTTDPGYGSSSASSTSPAPSVAATVGVTPIVSVSAGLSLAKTCVDVGPLGVCL